MDRPAWTLILTIAVAAACGKPAERPAERPPPPPAEPAPDTVVVDTIAAPAFTPVELPAAFPADFPIAPESIVVEARSTPDADGVLSYVALVVRGEPNGLFGWYRDALTAAGWMVATEQAAGTVNTLHATQGESTVDLAVRPHPGDPAGEWQLTTADIWKTTLDRP